MNTALVLDLGYQTLLLILMLSGPLLLAGLVVGLAVGVFQATTQINEMTLTFIPKIASIFGLVILLLPWMATQLITYSINLLNLFTTLMR
ncbi:MAG: flagellar biosynthesis protein FliQ [Chitinivibrionia bacterium]|nr:flagellar biosynthesis protein FliQ [Chitinivibrionia bacterium]